MEEIKIINIKKWQKYIPLTKNELDEAFNLAIEQVNLNMKYFGDEFQSPCTYDNIYKKIGNVEWTNGFWTGMLWLSYEFTNKNIYKKLANKNVLSFKKRMDKKIEVNHHDMGFLYSLSCVAAWKIDKNETARKTALESAKHLLTRFQEKGGFIQAWGNKGDNEDYRLIIDAMLNIPLLFWASEEWNNNDVKQKALSHYKASLKSVIREDGTTFHTYFFDPKTGTKKYGKTKQGYSDDSCWSRGQAWGIYGIPLTVKYNTGIDDEIIFKSLTNVFLNKLPNDLVPFWDLIFTDGDDHSRDSSAAAIAVCGILEMIKHLKSKEDKEFYYGVANKIARSLIKNYSNKKPIPGGAVLLHGVYSWHSTRGNKGLDQGNIWGDYFYMEMLYRLINPQWKEYW